MNKAWAEELRKIPAVSRLVEALGTLHPGPLAAAAARRAVEEVRLLVMAGESAPQFDDVLARASELATTSGGRFLAPVINATGVLLHTNLGRAPLSEHAAAAAMRMATGYSNLEYDVTTGKRGSRHDRAGWILQVLTGAEDALVTNNNAAAVMLALAAHASAASGPKEVIISRGELIEIGGGFRMPEIFAASGAVLREVGTTNRTHLEDYEKAIGPETAAIMMVHPSNYRISGFSSSVAASKLAELAKQHGLLLIHDLGSGLLRRKIGGQTPVWLEEEPVVQEALADGADVVTFSADKLVGGPQAGIALGSQDAIGRMKLHPMMRAVRPDKMTLAALETTLISYLEGRESDLPFWSMALQDEQEIDRRAHALLSMLTGSDASIEIAPGFSTTGGGSAPESRIPTYLLRISSRVRSVESLRALLLKSDPPVVARIEDARLIIDLRSVFPNQDDEVAEALRLALERHND